MIEEELQRNGTVATKLETNVTTYSTHGLERLEIQLNIPIQLILGGKLRLQVESAIQFAASTSQPPPPNPSRHTLQKLPRQSRRRLLGKADGANGGGGASSWAKPMERMAVVGHFSTGAGPLHLVVAGGHQGFVSAVLRISEGDLDTYINGGAHFARWSRPCSYDQQHPGQCYGDYLAPWFCRG
jgi:hypothetical protein